MDPNIAKFIFKDETQSEIDYNNCEDHFDIEEQLKPIKDILKSEIPFIEIADNTCFDLTLTGVLQGKNPVGILSLPREDADAYAISAITDIDGVPVAKKQRDGYTPRYSDLKNNRKRKIDDVQRTQKKWTEGARYFKEFFLSIDDHTQLQVYRPDKPRVEDYLLIIKSTYAFPPSLERVLAVDNVARIEISENLFADNDPVKLAKYDPTLYDTLQVLHQVYFPREYPGVGVLVICTRKDEDSQYRLSFVDVSVIELFENNLCLSKRSMKNGNTSNTPPWEWRAKLKTGPKSTHLPNTTTLSPPLMLPHGPTTSTNERMRQNIK